MSSIENLVIDEQKKNIIQRFIKYLTHCRSSCPPSSNSCQKLHPLGWWLLIGISQKSWSWSAAVTSSICVWPPVSRFGQPASRDHQSSTFLRGGAHTQAFVLHPPFYSKHTNTRTYLLPIPAHESAADTLTNSYDSSARHCQHCHGFLIPWTRGYLG